MSREERLEKAKKLESENRAILATPLMSEGNISPMQVGMFSSRQKKRWQSDAMKKMTIEREIRQLHRTDEEILSDEKRKQAILEDERLSSINILQSKIDFIHGLGAMSHNKNGKLRPAYQRTVDGYQQEINNRQAIKRIITSSTTPNLSRLSGRGRVRITPKTPRLRR